MKVVLNTITLTLKYKENRDRNLCKMCPSKIWFSYLIFFFQKVHDVLSQAWNAEGSPFKRQTFDPSKINVGQGGIVTINDNDDTEQK